MPPRDPTRPSSGLWALIPIAVLVTAVVLTGLRFNGALVPSVDVTVTSPRAGLVMDRGAKVKLRGVEVGTVSEVVGGVTPVALKLRLDPAAVAQIPANVEARIASTTAFGSKYVDLLIPPDPDPLHVTSGATIRASNVTVEVNLVFENLVSVLDRVEPAKLNAVLTAVAEGVAGQGDRIGAATSAAHRVLREINPRMDVVAQDWRALTRFGDAYSAAAPDVVEILDSLSTSGTTITSQADALNALLMNTIGFATSGTDLFGGSQRNFIDGINGLWPTTALLNHYSPTYACAVNGANTIIKRGAAGQGGNGYSIILDSTLLFGDDPYRYPDNLPLVAAKGGPGGKPSCGSLPDVLDNFPVRQLVTDTGWGTGLDIRPNPGFGHPFYVNYLPGTRAVPEPPSIRGEGPPAIGPVPYPGAPPYGAPLFGPDGAPLFGPPPGPPPLPSPAQPPTPADASPVPQPSSAP